MNLENWPAIGPFHSIVRVLKFTVLNGNSGLEVEGLLVGLGQLVREYYFLHLTGLES